MDSEMTWEDKDDVLWYKLWDEFKQQDFTSYTEFVKRKNLGIESIDNYYGVYRITNLHQWMLTKIRYGL